MLRPISEPTHVFGNASTATIPIVAALTSPNRTIAVYKLLLTASAATNITIQDTSGAALWETIPLTGSKALVLDQLDDGDPWIVTASGLGVQLAQSGSANIGFDVYYLGSPMPVNVPSTGGGQSFVPTTWNPADLVGITLSNGNLTATDATGTNNTVRAVIGKTTGKFYWETTVSTWINSVTAVGFGLPTASFSNPSAAPGWSMVLLNGSILVNASNTGSTLGVRASGNVIGIALDVGVNLVWYRVCPVGNWNGSGTANPATATGGVSISVMAGAQVPAFFGNVLGDAATANFGASAFSGAVPTGFTAGWG